MVYQKYIINILVYRPAAYRIIKNLNGYGYPAIKITRKIKLQLIINVKEGEILMEKPKDNEGLFTENPAIIMEDNTVG